MFPIPPLAVRPSVMMDASSRSEDDLTHQLVEAVRTNIRMRSACATVRLRGGVGV